MSYALFFDKDSEEGRSRTKQSFARDADINNIVARWRDTGLPPHDRNGPGVYADFTSAVAFDEAQVQIQAAQEAFMSLPAHVRSRFNNDPAELIDFVDQVDNLPEAEKLGLLRPEYAESGGSSAPQDEDPSDENCPDEG